MKRTVQLRWLGLWCFSRRRRTRRHRPRPGTGAGTQRRPGRPRLRGSRGRPNPIALRGSARPERYMEASGRQAAFLGREDGSFEAVGVPAEGHPRLPLSFGTAAYAAPMSGTSLASTVDVRPEASTVRYSHASFTVDATWFVPLTENGGVVLLDVDTSEPLTVVVQFRVDLKPMWPAALGGQYSYWDDTAQGVRGRRSERETRGARRLAVLADAARAAGPQPAGCAVAVLHHASRPTPPGAASCPSSSPRAPRA